MKTLLTLLLCLPLLAHAGLQEALGGPSAIGLHTLSVHVPGEGYNGENWGAYVKTSKGFIAGAYRNSFNRTTAYAGWTTPEWHRLSLTAALGSGYREREAPQLGAGLSLLAAPTVRLFTVGRASMNMVWIPSLVKSQVEVFHWTVERSF